MMDGEYTLRYIPQFEKDLNQIVDHIVFKLRTPSSAISLVNKIENAILDRLHYPLSFDANKFIK